jgi:hypothetical protein
MDFDKPLNRILISIPTMIGAVWVGSTLVNALQAGKIKTLSVIVGLPLILSMPYLLSRVRIQSMIGWLLFLFWLPVPNFGNALYLFELGIWAFLFVQLMNHSISKGIEPASSLKRFPHIGFLFYIFGALLTWLVSYKAGNELATIRITALFPYALCLIMFLTVKSVRDAERYLWIILTSAFLLSLLFLIGREWLGFVTVSDYAAYSGRLTMVLRIPYLGSLEMLPASTSLKYAFLLVFAYAFWISHPSVRARAFAGVMCIPFGMVIITTQGRGGAVAAVIALSIVTVYALCTKEASYAKRTVLLKSSMVIILVIGGLWYLITTSQNPFFYEHGMALFNDPLADTNLLGRFDLWREGAKVLFESHFIGVGLSYFETPYGRDTSAVHHYFLYILLSFGFIGFVGLMWVFLAFIRAYWHGLQSRHFNVRMICISCIGGMLGFLFGLQPGEPYYVVVVWAPLAIAFAASRLE